MTHLPKHTPNLCRQRTGGLRQRGLLLLPAAALALVLASCSSSPAPDPSPVYVTDTEPVGNGLKVIGYALVGSAVVMVLGSMIRS